MKFESKKLNLSFDGEVTGEKWIGEFSVKPLLSFYEKSLADQDYRALMGHPQEGSEIRNDIRSQAYALSQIKARLSDAPSWVKETSYLRSNFYDTNVIFDLYEKIAEVEDDWKKSVTERANSLKQNLEAQEKK